jgi:hypothetical protein
MNEVIEILKITLPALIVAGAVVFVIVRFLGQENYRYSEQRRVESFKTTLNLRLQAYERLMLFVERIEPYQLITRTITPQMAAADLHRMIILTVKEEFDHNISQQLYTTDATWKLVKSAKEIVVSVLNKAFEGLPEGSPAQDLAIKILNQDNRVIESAVAEAVNSLKKDIQELF